MLEARDRIQRPVDYHEIFVNRRSHGVLLDQPTSRLSVFEPPVRGPPSDSGRVSRGGNFSSWRRSGSNLNGHGPVRSPQGRENTRVAANASERGRGISASVLPSWYPRTPLRDITHIIRAIERSRAAGMGVSVEGRETEITTQQQVGVLETPVQQLGEGKCSMVTPGPFKRSSCPLSTVKVHKMLLDITKKISEEEDESAGFITPEKKLLNSIDKVEQIVMEEIEKLKSTPLAKREERERKVRTLMSMR